jgi:hypothetical protein
MPKVWSSTGDSPPNIAAEKADCSAYYQYATKSHPMGK